MIVGLSALMVSLVAVLVGVYSAYIDRAYARASVWPSIQLGRTYSLTDGNLNFAYLAINNGTGPAIIKTLKISRGETVVTQWAELIALAGVKDVSYMQSQLNYSVIPANQRITALQTADNSLIDVLMVQDNVTRIEMCYCSIYDECWQVDKTNQPQPVEQCELKDSLQFRQ